MITQWITHNKKIIYKNKIYNMAIPTYTREQLITLVNQYLQPNSNIQAIEHNEIETAIVNAIYGQIGDIKEIACDINYINTNFDMVGLNPGLGKSTGERYGWAICNGNNGTINKMGRVSIGYDPINYTIGATGGSKTHTLNINEIPPHFHHTPGSVFKSFVAGAADLGGNTSTGTGSDSNVTNSEISIAGLGSNYNSGGAALEKTIGGGQAHNNMQPYIVTLFIQRIAV